MRKDKQQLALRYFAKGFYSATQDGIVWRHRRGRSGYLLNCAKPLHTSLNNSGYLITHFKSQQRVMTLLTHQAIWLFFKGAYNENLQINHIDGNKLNNKLSNLELVTNSQNKIHALKLGLRVMPPNRYGKDNSATRKVECIDTGEIFETGRAAAQFAGVGHPTLWRALNTKGRTAGGFRFRYVE